MENYSSLSKDLHIFLTKNNIKPAASKLINQESVQVFIIDSSQQANDILNYLKDSAGGSMYPQLPVIGFDTETYINRKQTQITFKVQNESRFGRLSSIPSTIQIAISHHIVFVFRCYIMCFNTQTQEFNHNLFPLSLSNFLKSQNITKLGVAASKDAIELDYYFNCKVNTI